jgi:uncharacterized protein (DUF885 family)
MRELLVLTLLTLGLPSVACASQAPPRASDAFRRQLDEDWQYWMTQYPEVATSLGYPGQNARWTDYSQPAIDARAAYLTRSGERLSAVDRAQLAAGDQLHYDLYRDPRAADRGGAAARAALRRATVPRSRPRPGRAAARRARARGERLDREDGNVMACPSQVEARC